MEFEVRVVAGIENCYISLPLHLIQTLQSSSPSGLFPHSISLELRSSRNPDDLWFVSWSGSASSSASVEVARQFAECINLLDGATVQVRVVSNLPKATLVTIEPQTEDDWEVLELNAEHAEEALLEQVRVVREGMKFPLWLHGRAVVTFIVVSTFPKNAAVQLVQGTEVAVAPKRRKKKVESHDSFMETSDKLRPLSKALLRIQDPDSRVIRKTELKGVELGVVLTFVAFLHPETAKDYSLDPLQLVTLEPRLQSRDSVNKQTNNKIENLRMENSLTNKESINAPLTDKKETRRAIVRVLISESMAKGHVMIASSLRLYLRASLHSWVYLKRCNFNLERNVSTLLLSPCYFKAPGENKPLEKNALGTVSSYKDSNPKNFPVKMHKDMVDYSTNEKNIDALSRKFPCNEIEAAAPDPKQRLKYLIQAWISSQIDAVGPTDGKDSYNLILSNETLLHLEVRLNESGTVENSKGSSNNPTSKQDEPSSVEILYVLSPEESKSNGEVIAYEVPFRVNMDKDLTGLETLFGKIALGVPVVFSTSEEKVSSKGYQMTASSMNWMTTTTSDVTNRLTVLLSSASRMSASVYNLPLPGHVLMYGPPGSGKTLLARAVAKSLEEKQDLLAHICSELAQEKASNIRQSLSGYISEALDYAPSLVIFDDLDSIVSSSTDLEGPQPSTSALALVEFLTDIIDEYGEKRKTSCGIGPVGFIASAQSLESMPQSLRSSGRFDFHFQLPAPASSERVSILNHELQKRDLQCSDDILLDVASKCDGYDAYDLEILVDRTVHVAISRYLPSSETREKPHLERDDFTKAMHEFLPVAMRDITKSTLGDGRSGWDDVGGLTEIRNVITEMIELPSKFPDIFVHAPLRLRSNVLLYGPPGCGKTHIVGAAAAACSLRFISVKGPELLNKYIGASEQAVRDVFSKAASAAPCLLFFDEFDSIAPKRGHDNTGVTDRVVNQFLTELDGVEVLTGVFVFAATSLWFLFLGLVLHNMAPNSRPDLLDAALLRPGRLDRLLFCDFPSPPERLDILRVLSRKLPLESGVNLEAIAHMTEGFSGADLQALLSDAQLAAVHEFLEHGDSDRSEKTPTIGDSLLKSVASTAKPSVSDSEKQRLYGIYSQFLDSKRSISAKSRDSKGKRTTLA